MVSAKRILELGCGQALPAIAAAKCGALSVTVQDFNEEVIEKCTRPVFIENGLSDFPATYLFGSWESMLTDSQLKSSFDVIIMSETLYNVSYYPSLFALVTHCLAPSGMVLVGTKTFYYGLGGGQFELIKFLKENHTRLVPQVLMKINDMKSIERVILKLSYSEEPQSMQIDGEDDFSL